MTHSTETVTQNKSPLKKKLQIMLDTMPYIDQNTEWAWNAANQATFELHIIGQENNGVE